MPISIPCPSLPVTPGELCITIPGGIEVCANFPGIVPPSIDELARQLFAQVNAALAPIQPVFDILDAVTAIYEMIKALATLNPKKIKEQLPKLAAALAELAKLVPQISLVFTVLGILDALIAFLIGYRAQLQFQILQLDKIIAAETLLTRTGIQALADALDCARGNQARFLLTLNEGNKPIATIIGFANTFLEVINLGKYKVPDMTEVSSDNLEFTVEYLTVTIELLTSIRRLIPI